MGIRGQVLVFVGLSCGMAMAIAACSSFGEVVSSPPDAQATPLDAAEDRPLPSGPDASVEDTGAADAPAPGTKCSVRTVSTIRGVQRVQRYLDKLYFSDAKNVYVCAADACVPSVLAQNENDVRSLTVGPGYAFWLAASGTPGVTVVRRLSLSSASPVTVPSPGNFVSLHLTSGAAPELLLMGSHLYRSSPFNDDLTTLPNVVDFYYQPAEIALTSLGNRVLYNHPTASVAPPGPHVCEEGAFCQSARPVVAVKAAISALGIDGSELYYAYDTSLYRATVGGATSDGGVPVPGAPLSSFNGSSVSFVDPSGADIVVLTKDAQSNGLVRFAPKSTMPTATFQACPIKSKAPTSASADSDEIFVADDTGILAYHR